VSEVTRAEAIARGAARLAAAGVPEPQRDARLLFRWAAGIDGPRLAVLIRDPAEPGEIARFEEAVTARAGRVPVSHITGEREFWGLRFRVTADVLDPRPETEVLVASALEGPVPRRILDLGTGTGCILLALLSEWTDAEGLGTDISPAALRVAEGNAAALGLASRARFRQADWCAGVEGSFDLIVANPPYIAEAEMAALEPEVRLHEPAGALCPGGDGLDAYRRIAAGVGPLLAPGGRLMLEIGPTQHESVGAILARAGFHRIENFADLDGRNRVVLAEVQKKSRAQTALSSQFR